MFAKHVSYNKHAFLSSNYTSPERYRIPDNVNEDRRLENTGCNRPIISTEEIRFKIPDQPASTI